MTKKEAYLRGGHKIYKKYAVISQEKWYFGNLDAEGARLILSPEPEGAFRVSSLRMAEDRCLTLFVNVGRERFGDVEDDHSWSRIVAMPIRKNERGFFFEGDGFACKSLKDLIERYYQEPLVQERGSVTLFKRLN